MHLIIINQQHSLSDLLKQFATIQRRVKITTINSFEEIKDFDTEQTLVFFISSELNTKQTNILLKNLSLYPIVFIGDYNKNVDTLFLAGLLAQFNIQTLELLPLDTTLSGLLQHYKYIKDLQRFKKNYNRYIDSPTDNIKSTYVNLKKAEQLKQSAQYDFLTEIPNRMYFHELMLRQISRAKRFNKPFFTFIIDVDHFKVVNDTYGHDVGDALLKEIAGRLQKSLRMMDICARLGGDEFAVILTDNINIKTINAIAKRLLCTLSNPYSIAHQNIIISVSIGIARFDCKNMDFNILMKNADFALYAAKSNGRNRIEHFESELSVIQNRFHKVETALRKALEKDEIFMVFQPILDLQSEEVVCFEALARWQSSELKESLFPDEFIKVAEKAGIMLQLTQRILHLVCKQITEWQAMQIMTPVSINFSTIDIIQKNFGESFHKTVKSYGLTEQCIKLEITETALMENFAKVNTQMQHLRKLGYCISIDDFGTGYSSLSSLRYLTVDYIKIDKTFIQSMFLDTNSMQIVRAVIDLAKQLGISTIAEGVESPEAEGFLRQWGCRFGQGYYFEKPLKSCDVTKYIQVHIKKYQHAKGAVVRKVILHANSVITLAQNMNNQLAALLGYSELLLQKLPALTDEYNVLRSVHIAIEEGLNVMLALIDKMQLLKSDCHKGKLTKQAGFQMLKNYVAEAGNRMFRCLVQLEYGVLPIIKHDIQVSDDCKPHIHSLFGLVIYLKSVNENLLHFDANLNNDNIIGVRNR